MGAEVAGGGPVVGRTGSTGGTIELVEVACGARAIGTFSAATADTLSATLTGTACSPSGQRLPVSIVLTSLVRH